MFATMCGIEFNLYVTNPYMLEDGEKRMYIGEKFKGKEFKDALVNCEETVTIDEEGYGIFKVKGKSVSVWTLK